MFDFEKLSAFQKIKQLNAGIYKELVLRSTTDPYVKDQIKRAALSCMLNLAEGSGRQSAADKRHFYVMAKASALETAAILLFLKEVTTQDESRKLNEWLAELEEVVKMLSGLIRALKVAN